MCLRATERKALEILRCAMVNLNPSLVREKGGGTKARSQRTCCILSVCHSSHAASFLCVTPHMLHPFRVSLLTCCILSVCRSSNAASFLCVTPDMLHHFCVSLITCCILSVCHSSHAATFLSVTPHMLYPFCVSLLTCCILSVCHSSHAASFLCFIPCSPAQSAAKLLHFFCLTS